jgi:hypothetical protein
MRIINLPRPEAAGLIYPLLRALSMMSSSPRDWLPITSALATCGHIWSDFGKCNSKHLRKLKQSSIHSGRFLSMISSVTTCETYNQNQKHYTFRTFRLIINSNWGLYMTLICKSTVPCLTVTTTIIALALNETLVFLLQALPILLVVFASRF